LAVTRAFGDHSLR